MLQKSVNLYPAAGLPGTEVQVGTAVYTPLNYISDGTAKAGAFAFAGTTDVNTGGVAFPVASVKGTVLLGYVERTLTNALNIDEEGALVYKAGQPIAIARRGDYYHEATGAATVGQAVLCNPANGAVTYGDIGAANDTGWVVMTPAADAGELIVISNRGVDRVPAAG